MSRQFETNGIVTVFMAMNKDMKYFLRYFIISLEHFDGMSFKSVLVLKKTILDYKI